MLIRRAPVPSAVPTLNDLADSPFWVAWRNEPRAEDPDKLTKVPYSPASGAKAKSDNSSTWGPRAEAAARAKQIVNGLGGGVGVILGVDCGAKSALGGVDLDTCRSNDGTIADWAQAAVERFGSYTEISPSGAGLKTFFRYREDDLPRLRAMMGTETGRQFKWSTGDDHPPGFELYVSHRYFTVTGAALGEIADLRLVEFEDLEWIVKEAGPNFVGCDPNKHGDGNGHDRGGLDQSGSGFAFRLGVRMRRAGRSYEEFCEACRTDPETAEWYRQKGVVNGERELHRIWEKAERQLSGPPWNIVLKEPYNTARLLLQVEFSTDGLATLHRHRGGFYAWNGTAFPEKADDEIRAQIYSFLDRCVVTLTDAKTGQLQEAPVKANARIVNDVADALRAIALLPGKVSAPAWLDGTVEPAPEELMSCTNGLLHLPTRDLRPHSPAFFTHNALDYAYDPAAPKPVLWLAFLDQLWPGDAESIAALREMFGYCLTADTSQQKAFLLVGPKRSGKGTIARVLARLVGADNAGAPTLAGLEMNFGLAPLIGKRVAIISDARLGGRADQAVIAERLLSITGEDAITVDRKYREAWTGKLGARFLILTNELPRLADASGALASRFIVLVLTESFYGREDLALTNKLLAELPGILNWSIEGWRRLRHRGHFLQPASARDAVDVLDALGSPVRAFVRERCEVGPGKRENVNRMFRQWGEWCQTQGRDKPGTAQTFGRDLRAAVPGMRSRQHKNGDRFYDGIALREG